MAVASKRVQHTGNHGLFIIGTVFYLAFLGLFVWQTAEFVTWLFPSDQIVYRVITVAMFDVMALYWAIVDTFYKFATRSSHKLVQWAWAISFIASLVASAFYMILQAFTRLDFTPDISWVDVGYGIVITVTVVQILMFTFWLRQEWLARHPKTNDYEYDVVDSPAVIVTPVQSIDTSTSAIPQKSIDAPAQPRAEKITKVTVRPPFSQAPKKPLPRMHHAKYIVNKHPKMEKVSLANVQEVGQGVSELTTNTLKSGSSGRKRASARGATGAK